MDRYNHKTTEKKWQEYWQLNKSYKAPIDKNKPKFVHCKVLQPASQEPRWIFASMFTRLVHRKAPSSKFTVIRRRYYSRMIGRGVCSELSN